MVTSDSGVLDRSQLWYRDPTVRLGERAPWRECATRRKICQAGHNAWNFFQPPRLACMVRTRRRAHQSFCVGVSWLIEDREDTLQFYLAACVHDHDTMSRLRDHPKIMCDKHNGHPHLLLDIT